MTLSRNLILIVGLALFLLLGVTGCGEKKQEPAAGADSAPGLPSLQVKLDSLREASLSRMPLEQMRDWETGIYEISEMSVMQSALTEGDAAPDFMLPDADGQTVALDSLLADGPVVLVWYRGGWCPYCNLQLHAMQEALPQIEAAGGQLVAISPELPGKAVSTRERHNLSFEVLSDTGLAVARQYGLVYRLPERTIDQFKGRIDMAEYNATDSWELPLAATYVVDRDGIIRYAFVDADYRKRAEPQDIVNKLQQLQLEGRR